jgi:hypothetical protein
MKTIHKYIVTGRSDTPMPIGAKILHVDMQGRDFWIWAEVNTDVRMETRTFEVVGTGWELDENMFYVGTCFDNDFVWHIMEIV